MEYSSKNIWNKEYNYDSNLKDEIRIFWGDWFIDKKENRTLRRILNYNQREWKEKELIYETTIKELKYLKNIEWVNHFVKDKIDSIIKDGKEYIISNKKLLSEDWTLQNVSNITILELINMDFDYINQIILDKTRFNIKDVNGNVRTVYYSEKHDDYFYLDTCWKCEKVKIYDWDKLEFYY